MSESDKGTGYRHRSEERSRILSQMADEAVAEYLAKHPRAASQINVQPDNSAPDGDAARSANTEAFAAELVRRLASRS